MVPAVTFPPFLRTVIPNLYIPIVIPNRFSGEESAVCREYSVAR
jgi:hypothetical protein